MIITSFNAFKLQWLIERIVGVFFHTQFHAKSILIMMIIEISYVNFTVFFLNFNAVFEFDLKFECLLMPNIHNRLQILLLNIDKDIFVSLCYLFD